MPQMILHRDHTLHSLTGHMIAFEQDKETFVPKQCVKEALAIGARLVDGESIEKAVEEENKAPKLLFIEDPDVLRPMVKDALIEMKTRDKRGDFTAAGKPSLSVVASIAGLEKRCLSAAFIEEVWEEVK